jgi:uncharacterized protein (DUF58 family)
MDVVALALIFVFCLWLQAIIFCKYSFHKLHYKCEFSVSEAHEGDDIYLVETVYNSKLLPVPWLKVDIHTSRWLGFAQTCSVVAQDSRRVTSSFVLKSYQKTTRKWKLKCLKRGIFTTPNVTLISGDLLSNHLVSEPVAVNARLVVYPEIVDLEEMFTPVNLLQSDRTVNRWIVDDPFMVAGARDYTPADPLNRIHWTASARCGRLMVRKNEFTSQQSLTVLLNMQSQLYEYADTINKRIAEVGIKVAATLFDRAWKEGNTVRFGTNGCLSPDSRQIIFTGEAGDKEHITELFRILAGLLMKNVKDFEYLLDQVIPTLENTEVVIVTAYLSRRISEQVELLEAAGNTVSIILLDTVYEAGAQRGNAQVYLFSDSRFMEDEDGLVEAAENMYFHPNNSARQQVVRAGNINGINSTTGT